MAWLYRYTNGGLTVTPGIGVQWNSENQNEYYYGVSRKESARSGLRGYNPNVQLEPLPGAERQLQLPRRLECLRTARYTRLSDEVTDSPMVDKSWTGLISTGITVTSDNASFQGILCIKTGRYALFCITVVQYLEETMQQKMIQFSGDVSLPAIGQGTRTGEDASQRKQKLLHYARALSSV